MCGGGDDVFVRGWREVEEQRGGADTLPSARKHKYGQCGHQLAYADRKTNRLFAELSLWT